MYDPDLHAGELGIQVTEELLPGRWGEYRRDERKIVLYPGLTRAQWRCVLAHEIVHAEYDDITTHQPWVDARAEKRADRMAAQRLVSPADLTMALSIFPNDRLAVAAELCVTPWLLEVLVPRPR